MVCTIAVYQYFIFLYLKHIPMNTAPVRKFVLQNNMNYGGVFMPLFMKHSFQQIMLLIMSTCK